MREVEPEIRDSPRVKELCRAFICCADSEENMLKLLRDLHTVGEIEDSSNRWSAAMLLTEGGTVREVAETLGIAPAVVSQARQWLKNGTGGFELALRCRQSPGSQGG